VPDKIPTHAVFSGTLSWDWISAAVGVVLAVVTGWIAARDAWARRHIVELHHSLQTLNVWTGERKLGKHLQLPTNDTGVIFLHLTFRRDCEIDRVDFRCKERVWGGVPPHILSLEDLTLNADRHDLMPDQDFKVAADTEGGVVLQYRPRMRATRGSERLYLVVLQPLARGAELKPWVGQISVRVEHAHRSIDRVQCEIDQRFSERRVF